MLKQNIYPSRQGQFYRINLLKNNSDEGPFRSKDIMQNNKHSIMLLPGGLLNNSVAQLTQQKSVAAKNSNNVPSKEAFFNNSSCPQSTFGSMNNTSMLQDRGFNLVYANTLDQLCHQTKKINSQHPQHADNVKITLSKCEKQLQILQVQSTKLNKDSSLLRSQLAKMSVQQRQMQQQLYSECLPFIKQFSQKMQEFRSEQKDQYILMRKEIDGLNKTKQAMIKGIIECEKGILGLQHGVGCNTWDNRDDESKQDEGVMEEQRSECESQCEKIGLKRKNRYDVRNQLARSQMQNSCVSKSAQNAMKSTEQENNTNENISFQNLHLQQNKIESSQDVDLQYSVGSSMKETVIEKAF